MKTYNAAAIGALKSQLKYVIPSDGEKPERVTFDKSVQRELNRRKREDARRNRHEARHQLATGGWEEEDRNLGEVPEMAFSPDIVGESMPQNPQGFGVKLEVLL